MDNTPKIEETKDVFFLMEFTLEKDMCANLLQLEKCTWMVFNADMSMQLLEFL